MDLGSTERKHLIWRCQEVRQLYFCFAAKATAHEKAEAAAAIKKGVLKDDFSQKTFFYFFEFSIVSYCIEGHFS